jgi:hypothetical protein
MNFTREELQNLKEKAEKMACIEHLNSGWKRVLLRLADAACCLDAFIARTEESEIQ